MVNDVRDIRVSAIRANRHQPRRAFPRAEIAELARTMAEHGLLQPVVVRQIDGLPGYELIAGERRLRAAITLKWKSVPASIVSATDSGASEMALVENLMRTDLNPVEEGQALRQLLDGGYSYRKLAQRIGKDKGYIQNRVRLLTMPADIQRLVREKPNLLLHAYEIAKVKDARLRHYMMTKLSDDKGSRYTLSQMRHELRYAQKEARPSNDEWYALWDYDYLRDPTDGDEGYQGNCPSSVIERCLKWCISRNTAHRGSPKVGIALWIPFAGSGTGIEAARKLGISQVIASDINPVAPGIQRLDARQSGIPASSIDAIFAHPPYWNAVQYTKIYAETADPEDISVAGTLEDYLAAMDGFFKEAKRVLRQGGHLFVMIGDIRRDHKLVPLTAHLALMGERHFNLIQKVTKIRKRSSRLMPALISNAKKRGHLVDITDTILFFAQRRD